MKGPCKLEQKLPAALRRKAVAPALAAVMALAGVFGIGGAKLAGYAQRTAASFDSGMYSIAADLDARLNAAANLATVAGKVEGVDGAALAAVDGAIAAVQAAGSPAAKAGADRTLSEAVNALYDAANATANENQADLMAGELAEFNSRGNTIHNNDYNSNARRFNQDLGGQPARLIGALWGIEPAEYYE
ncbi:LemA family protein [Allofournierella sp.]|uniref:LemA family protein n=1 Tax=Allofournierella sp. TaxID=1940256 RepID=UPI003AB4CDD7